MIEKGKVSAVLDGGNKVTVIPAFSPDVVTHTLAVPFFLLGCLDIDTEVVYCQFQDNTGIVLARMDGEWNRTIEGDINISGAIKTAAGINLTTHTHTDTMGGVTSGPK